MDIRDETSEKRSTRLGNKSAIVVLPLPVSVEGCVPRLWATRRTLESIRCSADPVILYIATAALSVVGPGKLPRNLQDILSSSASLQFSSIAGPTSSILVGGLFS